MVHYLSAFVVRDLSALQEECLSGFIFSVRGGDIHGPDEISAESEDESVQASLRQMEAKEGDAEGGGGGSRDNREDVSPLHSPIQQQGNTRAFGLPLGEGITEAGSAAGDLGVGGALQGPLPPAQRSSLLRSLYGAPRGQALLQLDFLCFIKLKFMYRANFFF